MIYTFSFSLVALCVLQFCNSKEEKVISLEYSTSGHQLYTNLKIGVPPQEVILAIDLNCQSTWMSLESYKPTESIDFDIIGKSRTKIGIISYDSDLCRDQVILNDDIRLKDFNFNFLGKLRPEGAFETISFSYKIINENYSLVSLLYNQGLIRTREFSFSPVSEKNSTGVLYLGEIPSSQIAGKKRTKCSVNSDYSNWGCNLTSFTIGSNNHKAKDIYLSLDIRDRDFKVPIEHYIKIQNDLMKNFVDSKICKYNRFSFYYSCNCDKIKTLPKFILDFNGESLLLDKKDLFSNENGQCSLLMRENTEENWVLGTQFIKNHFITFNIDEGSLTFFSENKSGFRMSSDNFLFSIALKLLFVILTFLSIIAGILMFIVKRNIHSNKLLKKKDTPLLIIDS